MANTVKEEKGIMPKRKRRREERPKETPLPDENTVLCIVEKLLGGEHFISRCTDGQRRMTRIPGRLKRRMWVREGDVVLVAPWEMQPERRGDMIYRYTHDEVRKLVDKGIIPPELLEGV
jgi:translation initiation factor 1A